MVTIGETYVERVEKALMETVVLAELKKNNGLTLEQIQQRVKGVGGWDEKVDADFIESCVDRLEGDHIKEHDDRYTLTDDGREDLMKIENLFRNVHNTIVSTGGTGTMGTTATTGVGRAGTTTGSTYGGSTSTGTGRRNVGP